MKGKGKQMQLIDAVIRKMLYVCSKCGSQLDYEQLEDYQAILFCKNEACESTRWHKVHQPKFEYRPTAADAAWDRMQEKIKMQPLKALGE